MRLPIGVGELIADKYRVERVLGVGGMGVVVAATHVQLGELRAIKLMLPQVAQDADLCLRFLREAQAVARLRGEHVARVHDVGQLDGGAPYMVIEYIEGTELATILRNRGALPVEEAVLYALHACEALAEAHRHGMVHRDIKPGNLFVSRSNDGSPCLKVLDFGVAKTAAHLTLTGVMLGSPRYMPPEQIRGAHTVDARADIWALGAVLYEMLTREVPFSAPSQLQLFAQIAESAPLPPSSRRADLPAALDAVILRCLEKDRERRYPTVAALASALGAFAAEDARALPARIARVQGGDGGAPVTRPSQAPPAAGPTTLTGAPASPPLPAAPAAPPAHVVTQTVPMPVALAAPAAPAVPVFMPPDTLTDLRPLVSVEAPIRNVEPVTAMGTDTRALAAPSRRRLFAIAAAALMVAGIAAVGVGYRPATGTSVASAPLSDAVDGGPPAAEPARGAASADTTLSPPMNDEADAAAAASTAAASGEGKAPEPRRPSTRPGKRGPTPAALPSTRSSF